MVAVSASEVEKLEGGSKKPRVQYTDEYRKEAVAYYLKAKENDPDKTIRQCAEELGINEKTFGDWVTRFNKSGKTNRSMDDDAKELKKAQKRIKELEEQVEFLKKATAFFAQNLA